MIGKGTIKLINSLAYSKYRKKEKLFLVEGDKSVSEVLISGYKVLKLFATSKFISDEGENCSNALDVTETSASEIKKASLLKNPQNALAICSLPQSIDMPMKSGENLSVYLDNIQDPGNLGNIIRICDWFNVEYVFCSPETVDLYNPKVLQSSMGSFTRVDVVKTGFDAVVRFAREQNMKIFGAFLQGQNIYNEILPQKALLVMGNEGNGIQGAVEKEIDIRLSIPSFRKEGGRAESLNVAAATAIICSEFRRAIEK